MLNFLLQRDNPDNLLMVKTINTLSANRIIDKYFKKRMNCKYFQKTVLA